MPETGWVKGKLCGFLDLEKEKNCFETRYLILDKDANLLKLYFDHPKDLPKTSCDPFEEIDLNFISKVSDARKARPKAGLCFSITIAGDQMYLVAETEDEMTIWIDTLNEACKITVPHTTLKTVIPPNARNVVAGGVIVNSAQEEQISEFVPPALSLPSILSGYCTKQGAVRKNWKKRYFVLDDTGLSYYKHEMEREPIKSISIHSIVKAKSVDKEHHRHREYLFELITQDRTFNIQCDTERECKDWISKINDLLSHHQSESHHQPETFTDTYPQHHVQSKSVTTPTIHVQNSSPRPPSQEEIEPNSKAVWV